MQKGKPAKKYSQAARLHNLVRLIEARHGVTIEEMAEETGVDRRTIHRDLNAIHDAGYPLVSDWLDSRKVYRFITNFKGVPPIAFSLQELMTLYFLRSQMDLLQGTPFQDDLQSIFDKVNSVLPPRYAAHLERISRISLPLLQGRRDYHEASAVLKSLREALIYQYRVTLCYKKGGGSEAECYQVDPYTVLFYKGGLYLLATPTTGRRCGPSPWSGSPPWRWGGNGSRCRTTSGRRSTCSRRSASSGKRRCRCGCGSMRQWPTR